MDWEQPELELEEEEDHRHRRHSGSAVGGAFCSVKAGHQSLPQHLAEEEEVKLEELGSSGKDPFGRLGASVVANEVRIMRRSWWTTRWRRRRVCILIVFNSGQGGLTSGNGNYLIRAAGNCNSEVLIVLTNDSEGSYIRQRLGLNPPRLTKTCVQVSSSCGN